MTQSAKHASREGDSLNAATVAPDRRKTPMAPTFSRVTVFCTADIANPAKPVMAVVFTVAVIAFFGL